MSNREKLCTIDVEYEIRSYKLAILTDSEHTEPFKYINNIFDNCRIFKCDNKMIFKFNGDIIFYISDKKLYKASIPKNPYRSDGTVKLIIFKLDELYNIKIDSLAYSNTRFKNKILTEVKL